MTQPLVDNSGNISVHVRSDLDIPIAFSTKDIVTGNQVLENCAQRKMFIEIGRGFRRELAVDNEVVGRRRLQLRSKDLEKIALDGSRHEYIIRDETDNFAFIRLTGFFSVYGELQ